jgi:hypothetical protein
MFFVLSIVLFGMGFFIEDYLMGVCLQSIGITGFLSFIKCKNK